VVFNTRKQLAGRNYPSLPALISLALGCVPIGTSDSPFTSPSHTRPYYREPTTGAARCNRKNGFHKVFFSMREPSVFPVAAGTLPHNAARGQSPAQAVVWSLS
jgi:hypothetical protein